MSPVAMSGDRQEVASHVQTKLDSVSLPDMKTLPGLTVADDSM